MSDIEGMAIAGIAFVAITAVLLAAVWLGNKVDNWLARRRLARQIIEQQRAQNARLAAINTAAAAKPKPAPFLPEDVQANVEALPFPHQCRAPYVFAWSIDSQGFRYEAPTMEGLKALYEWAQELNRKKTCDG